MAEAGVFSKNLFDLLDDENQDTSAQTAQAKAPKDAKKEAAKPAAAAPAAAKKDETRLVNSIQANLWRLQRGRWQRTEREMLRLGTGTGTRVASGRAALVASFSSWAVSLLPRPLHAARPRTDRDLPCLDGCC